MSAAATDYWVDAVGSQLQQKNGPGGAANSVIPALPPIPRRLHMFTPNAVDGARSALGWRANDMHPSDIAHLLPRFTRYAQPGDQDRCWLWQGSRDRAGYGILPRGGRSALRAHRVSWVAFTGTPLTGNLTIDHLCNTKLCVNPQHLEPVTLSENVRRQSERRARTAGGSKRRSRYPASPEARERWRERSLAYYYANREERLAYSQRPEVREARIARQSAPASCDQCGKSMRTDSLRKHLARVHPEAGS